jgi:hypothetical protein
MSMPKTVVNNELRYYDALKTITKYMTVEQLRKRSEKLYGLPPEEALEMAYENVIFEAEEAIRGRRRPRVLRGVADRSDAERMKVEGEISQ